MDGEKGGMHLFIRWMVKKEEHSYPFLQTTIRHNYPFCKDIHFDSCKVLALNFVDKKPIPIFIYTGIQVLSSNK